MTFNAAKALRGVEVLDAAGAKITTDLFAAGNSTEPRYVGLYFSAHWCPPCRAFTPQLAAVYSKLKSTQRKNFEIVYCPWDDNIEEYSSYSKGMPWARLNFKDPKITEFQDALDVQSIPTLVIFDGDGNLVTKSARNAVPSDPEGSLYPWKEATDPRAAAGVSLTRRSVLIVAAFAAFIFILINQKSDTQEDKK